MGKSLLMLIATLFAVGGITTNTITLQDNRDGKEYETLKIGKLTMMAENLNYDMEGAVCFRDSEDFCEKYGRLYTYDIAMNGSEEEYAQGICPNGWHIPAAEEWVYIIQHIKEGKLVHKPNSRVTRLIPKNPLKLKFAGNKSASNDKVFLIGKRGTYMSSSTEEGKWTVVNFSRKSVGHELSMASTQDKKGGVSCRCVKDE